MEHKEEFIRGADEWFGSVAENFLSIRQNLEKFLLSKGFRYFYGGSISKREIYEKRRELLGDDFIKNLVNFQRDADSLIFAPEYTMRVYDFLNRHPKLRAEQGKVFYSQEFIRNENPDDILQGKTFDFWQIGYEIYSATEKEKVTEESFEFLIECLDMLKIPNVYYKLSDKRILEGILLDCPLKERRIVYSTVDSCNENPNMIYEVLDKYGFSKSKSRQIRDLLALNIHDINENIMDGIVCNDHSMEGYHRIMEIYKKEPVSIRKCIKLAPFIPKSWDACDTILFESRACGYPYAIAGGGSLITTNDNGLSLNRAGAGIGVTRIAEYMSIIDNK